MLIIARRALSTFFYMNTYFYTRGIGTMIGDYISENLFSPR
jgi:hypothetical protein